MGLMDVQVVIDALLRLPTGASDAGMSAGQVRPVDA